MLFNLMTEKQQGGVHISHTGEIPCHGSIIQSFGQFRSVQNNAVMIRMEGIHHQIDIFVVTVGLKMTFLKIFFIVSIGHRKCGQPFSLGSVLLGRYGCDNAGIESSGKESSQRHVGNELAFDGINDQMAHVSGSVFREIREGSVLRLPIRGRMKPFFITITTMTCFDFFNSLVYTATRGASRPHNNHFSNTLKIQSLFYLRMSQNGFNFGTEHESAVAMGIKKRFYPHGIPRQK